MELKQAEPLPKHYCQTHHDKPAGCDTLECAKDGTFKASPGLRSEKQSLEHLKKRKAIVRTKQHTAYSFNGVQTKSAWDSATLAYASL